MRMSRRALRMAKPDPALNYTVDSLTRPADVEILD